MKKRGDEGFWTWQFTTITGLESRSAGAIKFGASTQTRSTRTGASWKELCLSGIRAVNEILADIKSGPCKVQASGHRHPSSQARTPKGLGQPRPFVPLNLGEFPQTAK